MDDHEMAERILAATTPRKAKELGSEVSPYNGELWDLVREQLVYYGVREKFLANAPERELLLSTGSTLLAEPSPYDRVWGVGMTADDPNFPNPAKWKGDNLLGRVCMRVRADLRQLWAMGRLEALEDTDAEPDDQIPRMTPLQLSRIPATRPAVYCYARIVSHALPGKYPTPGSFLKQEHDVTIGDISNLMEPDDADVLPVAGWYELIRELNFQHALERI